MKKAKVIYNDDSTELWDVESGRAVESLKELIDRVIKNVPIDIYTIECALPDICEYQTKVGEVAGSRLSDENFPKTNSRLPGLRALADEGTDHLSVYVEHLHENNIKCLAEIRMSDTHHPLSPDSPTCPQFTLDHPEWIIKRDDGVTEVAMDYSVPEVRKHRLTIIQELLDEYDIDGLELNFNRWGKHFNRNEAREKAPIMTEYVGQVRKMIDETAKRQGKEMKLCVWMMSTVEECLNAGCDPETWVKNGWIDYLVMGDFNCTCADLRVDEFAAFCKGKCELFTQMGDMNGGIWSGPPRIIGRGLAQDPGKGDGYSSMILTNEEARAAARNHYHWGADGIAFWNISCTTGTRGKKTGPKQRARMFAWMNEVIYPEKCLNQPVQYRYVPFYKGMGKFQGKKNYPVVKELCSPMGAQRGQIVELDKLDEHKTFPFRMAAGVDDKAVNGNLRFRIMNWSGNAVIEADLNGTLLPIKLTPDPDNTECNAWWATAPIPDNIKWQGDNELGLKLVKNDSDNIPYIEELIIDVC